MAGLIKETWKSTMDILWTEQPTWLKEATDLNDDLAGGTVLNLATADADPVVRVNNNVWPLTVQQLTESTGSVALDYYGTDPSVVRKAQEKQFSYDKQKGDVKRHLKAILNVQHLRGAYNAAPSSHSVATPCLATSGTTKLDGTKAMTFEDIADLESAFDRAGISPDDRHLVLTAAHKSDLRKQDLKLFNSMVQGNKIGDNFSFKIHQSSFNPVFNSATGAKTTLGTAENPGANKFQASFAFQKVSLGYARGQLDFFSEIDSPIHMGTIINYGQYFLCLPIKSHGLAVIYYGI